MKNPILCLAAGLVLLCGCQKETHPIIEPVEPATTAISTTSFTQYIIEKGAHNATHNPFKAIETSELQFVVKFDSTAIYQSTKAENQYDINKLYGFSDNNGHHHNFSARFGWSWNNRALRLYSYIYNEGKVASQELAVVAIGAEVRCAIKVTTDSYLFYVNDRQIATMPRKAATSKASGYLLYPYFGGDEVAPHNVNIWIKNL